MKKFLLSLILVFFGMFDVSAIVAPPDLDPIKITDVGETKSYVTGTTTAIKIASSNEGEVPVYCLEPTKADPIVDTVFGPMNSLYDYPAIEFIIYNPYAGYTGDEADDKNYYVTQTAIWWYVDRKSNISDNEDGLLSASFKQNTNNEYVNHAKELMEFATEYESLGAYGEEIFEVTTDKIYLRLSDDGKYYETDYIRLIHEAKNVKDVHEVFILDEAENEIEGGIVLDEEGKDNSIIPLTEKFKIKIPVNSVESDDYKIYIGLMTKSDLSVIYAFGDEFGQYQAVVPRLSAPTEAEIYATKELTMATTVTKIGRIDSATNDLLGGSHLRLKNVDGKVIDEWDTTEDYYYIYDLEEGKYILEEVSAPANYEVVKKSITFEVSEAKEANEVLIGNTQAIKVPDTAASIPVYVYIMGAILVLSGLRLVFKRIKNN